MSGISNYTLNQKINAILGRSGGGGGVQNPMTSDLDGGAFKGVNFSDPILAQDLATKNYVDTTGGGGVTNPLTANLDANNFNITNGGIISSFYLEAT